MRLLSDDVYLRGVLKRIELAQNWLGVEMMTGNGIKIP